MKATWIATCALTAALVACAPLPATPQDMQAKRFEIAPGKAVIYLVRTYLDLSDLPAPVLLDDQQIGATYAGTYFRLEVPPGRHELRGYAADNGSIKIDVQADRIYFIRHSVAGSWRATNPDSVFELMDHVSGRAAVTRAVSGG